VSGPWEKYAGQDEPAAGPWAKYSQPAQVENGMPVFPDFPGEGNQAAPLSDAYDSLGKRTSRFFRGLSEADARLRSAKPSYGFGTAEAALSLGTGGIAAPVLGTAESIIFGTDPEKSFARYTYRPRSEEGQAKLGYLGALTAPLTESGADIAMMPLASQPLGPVRRAPKAKPDAVPTTQKLSQAAEQAYQASEAAGVVIRPESTSRAAGIFRDVAKAENLGKLPPKLSEAVAVLEERVASAQPLSLKDADKVRQLIGDAMKSTDAADRRLAKIIQGRYDNYIETLAPSDILAGNTEQGVSMLKQARELYGRRKNSEMLDKMERDAQRKGESNYTQAGVEHALRREFEKLANNDKKMRPLTPEQRAAVEKVAAPGLAQTMLRNIGKFDPTAGGMGSLVGTGTGGVAAWMAGLDPLTGLALPAAGFLSKRAATALTNRNVGRARESLVGRGLPTGAQVPGLLGAEAVPANTGLLGAVAPRAVEQIRQDLIRLDAEIQKIPANEPAGSARMQALSAAWERLRAELAAAESGGASP
jgi:hypothetical protein